MKSQATTPETTPIFTFVEPRNVCLSKDKNWVLIFMPDNTVVRKHKNFFKYVMSAKRTKKRAAKAS